jgi:histone deacetylase 1/2
VKKIADTMATVGNPLSDSEVISYILAGISEDHENFTTSLSVIASKGDDDFTLSDLYGHMVAYEARNVDRVSNGSPQFQHSANTASRGGGYGGFQRGGGGRGRGDGGRGYGGGRNYNNGGGYNGGGYGGGGGRNGGNNSRRGNGQGGGRGRNGGRGGKSTCQICGTYGHDALRCYNRFNHAIQPETSNRAANYSNSNEIAEPTWIMDSGATDHMTNDMDRLHVQKNYDGHDQIQVANGMHIPILHVGESSLSGPNQSVLHLKNVLHTPHISKNLISANKLAFDNNCFIELHPFHFLIKDRITKQVRLHGRAQGGLYPVLHPRSRQAHLATPSKDLWHRRLGHPTSSIVQAIISTNKLVSSSNKKLVEHICDACQQAKAHQLPYELSYRVSTIPLELVHTDVWGPAVKSSGGFSYYVSFLDDFSKFSWVYLLKHKSDVEHVFYQFQK